MNWLLEIALNNAVVATVLAVLVLGVTRWVRNPALCHGLWVLVLLKLITPPAISVPLPAAWTPVRHSPAVERPSLESGLHEPVQPVQVFAEEGHLAADAHPRVFAPEADPALLSDDSYARAGIEDHSPDTVSMEPKVPAASPANPAHGDSRWHVLGHVLVGVWLVGAVLILLTTGLRIYRFQRMLHLAVPAPADLQNDARMLAARIGMRRCPTVYVLPVAIGPMLWAVWGRPRVLFPASLLADFGHDARKTLLLHELSHLKRRDHWIRFLEIVGTALYWWHPVVWWVRREIRQLEEVCCDSCVVSELPDSRETYATALVEALRSLGGPLTILPPAASGVSGFVSVKRRVTMIMLGDHQKGLSRLGRLVLVGAAAVCLPLLPVLGQSDETLPESPSSTSVGMKETSIETEAGYPGRAVAQPAASPGQITPSWPGEPTRFQPNPLALHYEALEINRIAFSPDGKLLATAHGRWMTTGCVRLWDWSSGKQLADFPGIVGFTSVAFSPDSRLLACARWDGIVQIVDLSTKDAITFRTPGVARLAFSPDGKAVATVAERSRTIQFWDPRSGKEIRKFQGVGGYDICFSPDGKLVAIGGHSQLSIWDAETGQKRAVLPGHKRQVPRVAFSPDGKTLASAGFDGTLRLWDVASGKPNRKLECRSMVMSVSFSPDGRYLASAGYPVRLWDAATVKELGTLRGNRNSVLSAEFSPDGKTLATAGFDGIVRLWDVKRRRQTGVLKPEMALENPRQPVLGVACSPDGRTIASSYEDGTVKVRDLYTGRVQCLLTGHQGEAASVTYSPDGRLLATAGRDKTVRIWAATTGKEKMTIAGHTDWVLSVAFSPSGKTLATGSRDMTVRLWDLKTGEQKAVLEGHTKLIRSVAFSPDGKYLASGGYDKMIRLWHVKAAKAKAVFQTSEQTSAAIAFSPDGKTLAAADREGAVALWDIETGEVRKTLAGHSAPVWSLTFSPGGETLACGTVDGSVRLWDLDLGTERATFRGHRQMVTSLAFAPGATALVSGGDKGMLQRWDAATPPLATIDASHDGVRFAVFTPNGRKLVLGGHDGAPKTIDIGTGEVLHSLQAAGSTITCGCVSPDSRTLATGSVDRSIQLWNLDEGSQVGTLTGHQDEVRCLAFSPDGKTLISGGRDKQIKLWDIGTRCQAKSLPQQGQPINGVAVSRDGKLLAAAIGDSKQPGTPGLVRLWELPSGKEFETPSENGTCYNAVAFSADGTLLAFCGADGLVQTWDIARRSLRPGMKHLTSVHSVCFLRRTSFLAASLQDGGVSLWHVASRRHMANYEGHRDTAYSLAVSPDGTTLVTAGADGAVRLWSTPMDRGNEETTAQKIREWPRAADSRPAAVHAGTGDGQHSHRLWLDMPGA